MSKDRPRRVLIVDDDDADVMVLRRAFKDAAVGLEVASVSDPTKAVETVQSYSPDLVCVDFRMPVQNGAELIGVLREDSQHDTRALVVISASDSPNDIRVSYSRRANAYYVKPRSLDGYRRLAKRLVEHWFDAAQLNVALPGHGG